MRSGRSLLVTTGSLLALATSALGQHPVAQPPVAFAGLVDGRGPSAGVEGDARGSEWHPVLRQRVSVRFQNLRLDRALKVLAAAAEVQIAFSDDAIPVERPVSLEAEQVPLGDAIRKVLPDPELDLWVSGAGHIVIAPRVRTQSSPLAVPSLAASIGFHTAPPMPASSTVVQGIIRGRVTDAATGGPLSGVRVIVVDTRFAALTGVDGTYVIPAVPVGSYRVRAERVGYTSREQAVAVATGESASADFALVAEAVQLGELVVVGYGTQRRSDVTGSVVSVGRERLEQLPNTSVAQALQAAAPGVSVQTGTAGAEQQNEIQIRGQNSIRASNAPLIVVDGIPYNGPVSEINPNDVSSIDVLKDASASAIYGARGSNGVILITTKRGTQGKPRFSYEGYVGVQEATNLPDLMNATEWAAWRCQLRNAGNDCDRQVFTQTEREGLATGRSVDWLDLALRTGSQQQHNLSFSGGAEGTRYYIAGSILDVKGVAENDDFQRATLRVNLDQQVAGWLQVGTNTQLSNVDRSGMPASFPQAFNMSPLTLPYDQDGNLSIYPWPEDQFFANPLQGLLAVDKHVTRRVLSSNHVEVELPFVKGLSYRLNAGIDFAAQNADRYMGRNTTQGNGVNGQATVEDRTRLDWTLENIVQFTRQLGSHKLDLTGLYSSQGSEDDRDGAQARGFPNDVLTYYQPSVATSNVPWRTYSAWRLNSQMGRLNYGYADRYLLTLTARRDGYSGFGANHKYGVFPSLAVGWNVSNEPFWPASDAVTSLKLRASYGQNGNQAIAPYQTLARLGENSYLSGESTVPGYVPETLSNPNLRWETTTSLNFGVDFGLLSDRVTGTLDLYSAHTNDLLLDRLVSPVHGISRITENIGEVRNRGIELSLSTINVETSNFTWSTDFNVSANRNKIAELYGRGQDDVSNGWFIGQPINVNFGYILDGIFQTNDNIAGSAQPTAKPGDVRYRDLNGDGKITPADRGFIDDRDPNYMAGLTNTLKYGSVSLDLIFNAVQGVMRSNQLLLGYNTNEGRGNTIVLDYWTPENRSNQLPANRFNVNPLGMPFYQDASFVRLRDATLSFNVPTRVTERLGAEALRMYVNGRNLWTSTGWTGLDPELDVQTAIPLERLVTVGVNLRF